VSEWSRRSNLRGLLDLAADHLKSVSNGYILPEALGGVKAFKFIHVVATL
jgi:hypothetical protein